MTGIRIVAGWPLSCAVVAVSILAAGMAPPANGQPVAGGVVDLASGFHVRVDGAAAGDNAGRSVAGTGDVNGDGRGDMIVGAQGADLNGRANAGAAYVVFGGASGTI